MNTGTKPTNTTKTQSGSQNKAKSSKIEETKTSGNQKKLQISNKLTTKVTEEKTLTPYGKEKSIKYKFPHDNKEFWLDISEKIRHIITDSSKIERTLETIAYFAEKFHDKEGYKPTNLKNYLDKLPKEQKILVETKVIPMIANFVLDTPKHFKEGLHILSQNIPSRIKLSKVQAACLLSNIFYGTLLDQSNSNMVSERSFLYYFDAAFADISLSTEKIKCIFNYFEEIYLNLDQSFLYFQRSIIHEKEASLQSWLECTQFLKKVEIIESGGIEDTENSIEVDFANKYIGGSTLYLGMVQEEIMMLLSPECIIAIILSEFLLDNETLFIKNPQRYSDYTGYGDEFLCTGRHKKSDSGKNNGRVVTAIDAVCTLEFEKDYQYTKEAILRDLNKSYVGFQGIQEEEEPTRRVISTGKWGCGVFQNDPEMKFLQQWISSSRANRDMNFYTFGKSDYSDKIKKLTEKFAGKKVCEMVELLISHSGSQEAFKCVVD